jgi:hypothetical protein
VVCSSDAERDGKLTHRLTGDRKSTELLLGVGVLLWDSNPFARFGL